MKSLLILLSVLVICSCGGQALALDLDLLFTALGDTAAEDMGYGVQSPGDLNGNGYSEVFVFSWGGRCTKVFDGGDPPSELPIRTYSGVIGRSAWAGDINRDGRKDFVINNKPEDQTGQIEIYYGCDDFYSKTEPDLIIYPNPDENGFKHEFQFSDYDNDGYMELIFIASRPDFPIEDRLYFYETYPVFDSIADDTLTFWYDVSGYAFIVGCIGDVNGDGYADYATSLIGEPPASSIKIFFGSDTPDAIPDLQIWTPFEEGPGGGQFGWSIVPVGDINWDNYNDFIVTSNGTHPPCIFYGGNPFDTIPKILEHPGDVADLCGDINHDGWDDIAVGYTNWDLGYGLLRVYFGARDMDTLADITIWNSEVPAPKYHFGQSVGSAGDFNGDGVEDLVVGSRQWDIEHWNKGRIYVFAGSDTLPLDADDETGYLLPVDYDVLYQNYPNPFNETTTIRYDLARHRDKVELSVYNILGQVIDRLYCGSQEKGTYMTKWDVHRDVASGIYFYVLRTEQQLTSEKMLLLK